MNASRPAARDDARPRVPRSASVLVAAMVLVLLLPVVAALPDLPFGRWQPLLAAFLKVDAVTGLFTLPIFLLLGALSVAPVVLAAAALPGRPLAFWLGLAAYLAGGLAGWRVSAPPTGRWRATGWSTCRSTCSSGWARCSAQRSVR